MAPDLLQAARVRYRHKVPKDCFLANVPEWLRLTPDHVIAPSHGLQVKEGCKWIKVSQYEAFVQACRLFWNDYGLDAQQQSELHVIAMPYMPLIDAHKLHKLVNEPDILPYTFAESLEYLKMKEARKANNESVGVDLGLARLFHEANEEEDDEESDWERKEGSITFPDLGGAVRFVVTNYSVLWAKAEKQCLFMFMSDPMEDIISRLETCEKLLYYPPADMRQALEDDLEQAKRELIFAMYQSNIDPHDVIHSLYPEMHTYIYKAGCVHCDPSIDYADEEDPPQTMLRLLDTLTDIGFQETDTYSSVEKAQTKLMCAQGHLEAYMYQFSIMHNFSEAHQNFRFAVQPLLHELRLACHQASVIGVSHMDLDGET